MIAKDNFQLQIIEKNLGYKEKEIKRKLPAGSIYLTASVIDADSVVNGSDTSKCII
jgi:hypothetical protein